jgi:protease-4
VEDVFGGRAMGSDTITEIIREVRQDGAVKAVVFRVDSPGGSGLASDVIWREVEKLKEAGKPVVVSMGDVAASGGYYIACGADAIVAEAGTLTGSIGVVSGKFALGGLYEKVGYGTEIITRGQNAAIYSSSRPFTDSEREVIVRQMESFYDDFLDRVSQGRGKSPEEIHEIAQGRVWTGTQALQVGLVDEIGGLDRALEIAREKAGIAKEAKIRLAVYPRKKTLFEVLMEEELGTIQARRLTGAMPEALRGVAEVGRMMALFEKETALPLMPWRVTIR